MSEHGAAARSTASTSSRADSMLPHVGAAASAATAAAYAPRAEPCVARVLLIDDDAALLDGMSSLARLECELVVAPTAQAALDRLASPHSYSVVICDDDMPGLDAVRLLASVRESRPEAVRMLLSSQPDPRIAAQGLADAAIFRFLPKPLPCAELRVQVEAALAEHARLALEGEQNGQYRFMSKVMTSFAERLDLRLGQELRRIHHLIEYSNVLSSVRTLDELATVAVAVARKLLPDRAIALEIAAPGISSSDLRDGAAGDAIPTGSHAQPLETSEGCIGTLRVGLDSGEALSQQDREIVAALAGSAALAAWNLLRRKQRDLAQQAAITALALLAEKRDNETGRHVERVSSYCRLVALGMREDGKQVAAITDSWIDDLVRSAPLHDIGKVGIPDAILLKPGKLTPDEWEIMKTHAAIGAETLRSVAQCSEFDSDFLRLGIEIAGGHHEKWNGTGYPRGLAGDAIPLSARIVALADCYDALTTNRPYKTAWTHEAALRYVVEHSGTQFDPDVIAAFARRANEADRIRSSLADEPVVVAAAAPASDARAQSAA